MVVGRFKLTKVYICRRDVNENLATIFFAEVHGILPKLSKMVRKAIEEKFTFKNLNKKLQFY